MTAPISQILDIALPHGSAVTRPLQPSDTGIFQSVLQDSIGSVQTAQTIAHHTIDRFLSGEGEELHHVALATQQAELSFELFMQVRNKVVQAYQDIMRMQI